MDTGTSLLAGPTEIMEALDEKLGVKSDCSNMGSLPMLGFSLNGQVRPRERSPPARYTVSRVGTSDVCNCPGPGRRDRS